MILLYGGTFNPIHYGHIKPLQDLARIANADKLIYIPCHIPPHKAAPSVSSIDRLEMTKLALKNEKFSCAVEVSDYEIKQSGKSYTALTLSYFKNLYPGQEIAFVIGTDSLLSLHTWYDWQKIVEDTRLYVLTRPGYDLNIQTLNGEIADKLGESIHLVNNVEVPIASTELREQIVKAQSVSSLNDVDSRQHLPLAVIEYIREHKLYL